MANPKIGTREEWQAARDELARLEAEHAELSQKVTEQRRQLPWVAVEDEYVFVALAYGTPPYEVELARVPAESVASISGG